MDWISIKDKEIDEDKIHFLVDGESIYISGTKAYPFFVQLSGEKKSFCDMNWTHWMPLPQPPTN